MEQTGVQVESSIEAPLNWEQRLTIQLAKREWIAIAVCFGVATVAILPIFIFGFPRGSDTSLHYRWSAYFTEALREGVLYPRWLAGANRGHGSPVMNYYGPVPLYAAAAFNLIVGNTLHAMMLSCWLAMALSGVTMYVCARSILSRGISLFAAVFYMLAAYHLFDLFQAGAINEYWSFVWLPTVFDAIHRIANGKGWRASVYLGVGYALLLLTHVPIPFTVTLILPFYVLLLTRRWRHLIQTAAGLVLGLGLSACFLVSTLFERKYVKIEAALGRDYREFFLFRNTGSIWQTNLFSPSQDAYNGNYLLDATLTASAFAILLILSSWLLWSERKREPHPRSPLAWRRAIWGVAVFTLFMTTRRSAFIWRAIPQLAYLQFPNRWLVLTTAATSLITAAALAAFAHANRRRLLYGAVFVIGFGFNLLISVHEIVQSPYNSAGVVDRLQGREIPMYTPVWRDDDYKEELVAAAAEVLSGDADVQATDDNGNRQSYLVTARTSSTLGFRQLYFPGWVARVDGKPVALGPNRAGSIQLTIEPGEHELSLRFEDTTARAIGKLISAVSLLVVLAIYTITRAQTST